ncbi:hypothetical protein AVEN_30018-1 [Araneus ventricosus]|uniref:Uncharacterized protein n=1 Tax=Araneus ventricosus TaxID=182803 RepID=A0A4Y2DYS3_ARAVE|nr:hypothetical protein AVEN_30018-1 [Araneus ventricosus]
MVTLPYAKQFAEERYPQSQHPCQTLSFCRGNNANQNSLCNPTENFFRSCTITNYELASSEEKDTKSHSLEEVGDCCMRVVLEGLCFLCCVIFSAKWKRNVMGDS